MGERVTDPMQRLSKIVFGQVHRLAVMAAVANSDDGLVNPTDLASELGFSSQSAIQAPIRDLEDAGLLVRLPAQAGRTYYQRTDSAAWRFALDLVASVEKDAAVSRGATPRREP